MKIDTWMPLYVNEYLGDTMRLTTEQHGAYLLLIMEGWKSGGHIPDDDNQLAAITKMNLKDWRKISPLIRRYFTASNGELIQSRLNREIDKAQRLSEIRRETGMKGGRPKRKAESDPKPIGFVNGNQNGMQTETPTRVAPPLPVPSELPSVPTEPYGGGGAREREPDDWPEGDPAKLLVEAVDSPWLDPMKSLGLVTTAGIVTAWRLGGASWTMDVLPVVTGLCAGRRFPIATWKFFDAAIARSIADNRQSLQIPQGGTVVPIRGSPSIADRIAAENAEAQRLAFARMDADG